MRPAVCSCRQVIPFEGFVGSVQTGKKFALASNSTQSQGPSSNPNVFLPASSTNSQSPGVVGASSSAAVGPAADQQLSLEARSADSSPVQTDPGALGRASSNSASMGLADAPAPQANPNNASNATANTSTNAGPSHPPTTLATVFANTSDLQALSSNASMLADRDQSGLHDSPEPPNLASLTASPLVSASASTSPSVLPSTTPSPSPSLQASHVSTASTPTIVPSSSEATPPLMAPPPPALPPLPTPMHAISPPAVHALPPATLTGSGHQAGPPDLLPAPTTPAAGHSTTATGTVHPFSNSTRPSSESSPNSSSVSQAPPPAPASGPESQSPGPAPAPGDAQAQNVIESDPQKTDTPVIVLASLLGAVVAAALAGMLCHLHAHRRNVIHGSKLQGYWVGACWCKALLTNGIQACRSVILNAPTSKRGYNCEVDLQHATCLSCCHA